MSSASKQDGPITYETFMSGAWKQNPVFSRLLGLCPALAVSNTAVNSLVMGLASSVVVICSSIIISLLRNVIPKQIRIAAYMIVIATFVTAVDYGIHALSLELYDALGAFILLIVVNCMILGQCESHASKHRVTTAAVNAGGTAAGFTAALLMIGSIREILGFGTFFGITVFGEGFQTWAIFVLPPGGFFVLAVWLIIFAMVQRRKEMSARPQSARSGKEVVHAT